LIIVYQIIICVGLVIASPYLLLKALIGGHGIKERLGVWNFKADDRKVVWFHAASMGELKIITSILPRLQNNLENGRIVITTVTKTGKTKANRLSYPAESYYLPIDLSFILGKVVSKIQPSLLILAETEIWPVFIEQISKAKANIVIVNGRISGKSFKFYKFVRPFVKSILKQVNYVMAQTDIDAERFIKLGAKPDNVAVYGNTKFDQILEIDKKPPAEDLKDFLTGQDAFVFIAGSVRAGEFKSIAETLKQVMGDVKQIRAIIAPRHLKEVKKLERTLQNTGVSYVKRTVLHETPVANWSVMILDTMGELGSLYRFADLAFVGGSIVNIGGHDPLEPASSGCAVCFGRNMENSRLFADILVESKGAVYIKSSDELASLITRLAVNKDEAKIMGENARQAVLSHSGVSEKIVEKLTEFI